MHKAGQRHFGAAVGLTMGICLGSTGINGRSVPLLSEATQMQPQRIVALCNPPTQSISPTMEEPMEARSDKGHHSSCFCD